MRAPPDPYSALEARIAAAIAAADPALFEPLALEVHAFQRANNPAYAAYCAQFPAPAAWHAIPSLPLSAFKLAPIRSFPAGAETGAFRTSGTTGESFGTHHFASFRLYDAAILRGWDLLGLPALPHVLLIAGPAGAPHSSLSHMIGVLKQRAPGGEQHPCFLPDGKLDSAHLASLLASVRAQARPVLLFATALSLLHALGTIQADLTLPPGSLLFETGGYKGSGRTLTKTDLYGLASRRLGIPADSILNEYGMTELSSQAYTRGLGTPHAAPPWTRFLVVHPATGREVPDGETGLLRVFDLANLGSVIALQTRDLAIRRGPRFELLGRDPAALPRGCSRAAGALL